MTNNNKYWRAAGTCAEAETNAEASRQLKFTSRDKPKAELDLP